MRSCTSVKNKAVRGIRLVACAGALAAAFTVSVPRTAHAGHITIPDLPPGIGVDEPGNKPYLVGHAAGSQNYICLPSATASSGVAFMLFTPEATLFNDDGDQLITHFFSNPDPKIGDTILPTWESSRDTSTIWAAGVASSTDPQFVEEGAVAWVKLQVLFAKDGPNGGDKLTETTFVQRLNTHGGVAPSTGCSSSADVGTRAFVPYTADYFFYRADDSGK